MKKIAVYCGANLGNKKIYQESAVSLGKWITENQYGLVYGGGNGGLMGILANTVLENQGSVIGVMPKFLQDRELAHNMLTELFIVTDMHERKAKMMRLADAYIALPGGPGTLEEISEVVSWGRVGQHKNPCIFFNVDGYYDVLQSFFDKMVEEGFLTSTDRKNILFSDSLDEIQSFIDEHEPPQIS